MYIAVFRIMFLDFSLISQFGTHVHLCQAVRPKCNSILGDSVGRSASKDQMTNCCVTGLTTKMKMVQISFLHSHRPYVCSVSNSNIVQ